MLKTQWNVLNLGLKSLCKDYFSMNARLNFALMFL